MAKELDDDVTTMSGLLPEDTYPATVIDFYMCYKRNDDYQNQNGGEIQEVKSIILTYAIRMPDGSTQTVDTDAINFQSIKATKLNEKSGGVKYLCMLLGIAVNPMEMTDAIAAKFGGKARGVAALHNPEGKGISGSLQVRHVAGKKAKYLDISKAGCFTPANKLMNIEPIEVPEGYENILTRWLKAKKILVRNAGTDNEQYVIPSIAERKLIYERAQAEREAGDNSNIAAGNMGSDEGDSSAEFEL